jgi:SOS-response transcriptional repressor LexA
VLLIPENPTLEPFEMVDGRILGKVVAVLRRL